MPTTAEAMTAATKAVTTVKTGAVRITKATGIATEIAPTPLGAATVSIASACIVAIKAAPVSATAITTLKATMIQVLTKLITLRITHRVRSTPHVGSAALLIGFPITGPRMFAILPVIVGIAIEIIEVVIVYGQRITAAPTTAAPVHATPQRSTNGHANAEGQQRGASDIARWVVRNGRVSRIWPATKRHCRVIGGHINDLRVRGLNHDRCTTATAHRLL